jgi:GxxExxY protein
MNDVDKRTNDISYQIIGAAMDVHRTLSPGLLESIYEDALCIELEDRYILFERQKETGIFYKGRSIGNMCLDLLVDDRVVVELKAIDTLLPVHTAQLITYLKITDKRLGLLINFNVPILKHGIKRYIL